MAAEKSLTEAVQAAIVASAHAVAHQRLSSTLDAFERLGALSSGRWRSATRDLDRLEEDLERALDQVSDDLARRAEKLELPEEALWSVGEAAGVFDTLEEDALDLLEEDRTAAIRLLESDVLFGVAFLDDADSLNRGTTLLFGWSEPLAPAAWPWEANWVAGERGAGESEEDNTEELDLFEVGDLQAGEELIATVCQELDLEPGEAIKVLTEVATAFTRATLLAAADSLDDENEGDPTANGHV